MVDDCPVDAINDDIATWESRDCNHASDQERPSVNANRHVQPLRSSGYP